MVCLLALMAFDLVLPRDVVAAAGIFAETVAFLSRRSLLKEVFFLIVEVPLKS